MPSSAVRAGEPLRIVGFHVVPQAYQLVARWAERHGHDLLLVVTANVPPERYGPTLLTSAAPPDLLVSDKLKRVVAPVLRALAPDLIVVATYPRRIPPEIIAIPRFGAVNLHPTPLPRGRGPNPMRMLYAGEPTLGAALHRLTPEFDTGPLLSRVELPAPENPTTEEYARVLFAAVEAALEEGIAAAIAGEPGIAQDESSATYLPVFTDAEYRLDWREPGRTIQRRTTALNFPAQVRARAEIGGQDWGVRTVQPLPVAGPCGPPGTLLERAGERLVVCAGDGPVAVEVVPLQTSSLP